uniref:Defective in cullin neddylation protein n=1 Tax=Strigamia maritima TaxID=126957 RepID=T1JNZ5_STRMM
MTSCNLKNVERTKYGIYYEQKMGNCLACCKDHKENGGNVHESRFIDTDKVDLTSASSQNAHLPESRLFGGLGDNSNNGNRTSHQNSEKRMFYPRIPPILSGSGDSKRSSQSRNESVSEPKIISLFEQYKDGQEDAILSEGIERFCRDLEVKPEEYKVLLLAWKFSAETMCKFTKQEFVTGCKTLKVDSIKGIQNRFPDLVQEAQNPENFKDFYRFTFRFGLDSENGQRILPSEMAICLWKLVFSHREPVILSRWLAFLEKHQNVRGIPRDTWNMFLNFCDAVKDDLSMYDDTEAWPSLFDDFVEYENDQTNQNVQHKENRNEESD